MEKQTKKYTVTLVAPIRHVMPGIDGAGAYGAAVAAGKMAKNEMEELYGKGLPGWFAIAETTVDPSQKPLLRVHDEAAASDSGDSFWQLQDDGKVSPATDKLAAALAFAGRFLDCYQKATLFAWDDKVMVQLYKDALAILGRPCPELEPALPKRRRRRKQAVAA